MTPVILKISDTMTDVDFGALDLDESPNVPTTMGIKGIPTLILFSNSEVIATRVGASKESDVLEWLQSNLSKK